MKRRRGNKNIIYSKFYQSDPELKNKFILNGKW